MNTSCQWLQLLTTDIHIISLCILWDDNMNTSCQWLQLLTTVIHIISLYFVINYEY